MNWTSGYTVQPDPLPLGLFYPHNFTTERFQSAESVVEDIEVKDTITSTALRAVHVARTS